jgi:hypothetical protein
LRAEGFSCSLDVLHGGLGRSKLRFQKVSSKPWIWIRIGIQPKMLDSDPDSMNPDLKHRIKDIASHCSLWLIAVLQIFTARIRIRVKIKESCGGPKMELWKVMDTLNGGEEGLQTSGHRFA